MLQDPTFWVAMGFLILAILAVLFVRKPILGMLDARVDSVRASLDEAASLREEAQQLLAEYQRKQRDAVKETEVMVARAKEEAERISLDGAEALEAALKRREELAIDKIAQAEADAVREVQRISVEVAIDATRVLIADKLDGTLADALIDESIFDISNKLH